MMKIFVTALFALPLVACGGRAQLDSNSYRNARRVWNAQINSQPSKRIANLSAQDAKNAVGADGKSKSSGVSFGRAGKGGQLTPSTTDLSGGGGPGDRKIRLQ